MSKHQRRKGNVQSASSAHAAELLTSSGHALHIVTFGDYEPFTATSLENRDADEDVFDAKIKIALRKTLKKDLQTREKGLKELRRLVEEVAFDDVRKSFKHFIALFSRLALDAAAAIRSNAVCVLGDYIKKLQKSCELYLKKVLPYVILMMYDGSSQVINESKSMLTECFPNEKYDLVIEIFKESVFGITLKFISGEHPLLVSCGTEETEELRFFRLASQSLQYLHWFCAQSSSEEQRNRIFEFFINPLHKRLLSSSAEVISATMILANRIATLPNGWDAILRSAVPTTALAHLDNVDRNVSRTSALFILEMTKADVLFEVLDIDKTVIRRIVSLIKQKKSFWNYISPILVPVIKAVLDKKMVEEGRELLTRILSAFFDGMSWNSSFPSVAWVNTFSDFAEFGIWWAANLCADDLVIMDEFSAKIWLAMKFTLKWNNKSLVRKMVHLPELIVSKWLRNSQIANRLRRQIQDHLLDELPLTGTLIEELFCDKIESIWSNFVMQLLKHSHASQKLVYNVVEKCNDDLLNEISSQFDLCEVISSKIDWNDDEDAALHMLKLLMKFTTNFDKQITQFYTANDELTSVRFLIAFGLLDKEKHSAMHLIDEDLLLVRAMRFCVHQVDLKRWNVLMDIIMSFSCFETALRQVLEENRDEVDQKLLITVLNKRGQEISECLRSDLVNLIVGQVFDSEELSSEVINETVKVLVSSGVDMKLVAQTISNKIKSGNLLQFDFCDIDLTTKVAASLPSSYAPYFIVSSSDLADKLAAFDKKYGLEIMDAQECLNSSIVKSLFSGNVDDDSTLLPHLGYASFIISYLEMALEEHVEYCMASFLYAVAISSLVSINTICSEELIDTRTNLNNLISNLLSANEKLKESLLSECISLIVNGNESLCLFIILRLLANNLCEERVEALFKASVKGLDPFNIEFCSAALRLQGVGKVSDDYFEPFVSMKCWTSHFEIASSLKNSVNSLQLLTQFILEGRSPLEKYLFIYSNGVEEEQNIFNCALLRFLASCCPYLSEMDNSMRDFLCCAIITSLESANTFWGECKSSSFMLFGSISVRLFNECAQIIAHTKDDIQLAPFRQDWSNFFCPAAQNILLIWFFGLTTCHSIALQNTLCISMNYITEECIQTASLPPVFDVELDFLNYDEHLQSVVIPLHTLINSSCPDVQIAALKILKLTTKDMLKIQNMRDEENDLGDEKLPSTHRKQLPVLFTRILDDTVTNTCILPPKLLIWDAFISSLSQFELLERVAYCSAMGVNVFVGVTDINNRDYWNDIRSLLPQYAFQLFYNTCSILPAVVRQWYIRLPRAAANVCKSFVTKSVSPLIWKTECSQFASRKMPNKLKVRLLRTARQIVAEYDLEDSTMTLTIEYPVDYPLSIPLIEDERAIVSRETRRKWLLQLTMFLTHQNGSIVDAVLMWAGNIEKHMEGSEDCTICMMTVHSRTYQLPRVRCKQCKKRFHSDCLYKWFDSSNQSTCPLCRASFR